MRARGCLVVRKGMLRMGSQKNPSTQEDKGIAFSTKESSKMERMKIVLTSAL